MIEGRRVRVAESDFSGQIMSELASGGTVPPGDACECDNDCANWNGQCNEAVCQEDELQPGIHRCAVRPSPALSECEIDGLYCTRDYCDGLGNCFVAPLVIGGTTPRTPCLHTCSGGTASGERCFFDGDCPGGGICLPRIDQAMGGSFTTCDEATNKCGVSNSGAFLGRCCTGANAGSPGVCSYTTFAGCAGFWSRITDPFDLNECNCPEYSAGMAPADEGCTVTAGVEAPAGCARFVTGTNRRCSISRSLCRNATLDCHKVCDAGPDVGLGCSVNADCDQIGGTATCVAQTCDVDANLCATGNYSVGDDYTLASGLYMRLSQIRFRGGVDTDGDVLSFEVFDTTALACSNGAGNCAGLSVGDSCGVGAGTCVGPLRVASFGGFRFAESGMKNYTLTVDCGTLCDTSTTPDEQPDPATNVIPPAGHLVMRASSTVDSRNNVLELSRGYWAQAGATQVGSTNPDGMWLDHFPNQPVMAGTGRLMFELIGETVPDPAAACCDPPIAGTPGTPGTCSDLQGWECTKCIGGPFDGQVCRNTNDCGGLAVSVCSDIDWKGKKFDSAPAGELCSSGVCNIGACCDDNTGECTETADVDCTGAGQTFLGLGTTCDPNCCQQAPTGGDCCGTLYWCEGDPSANASCNAGNVGSACGSGGTCQECSGATVFQFTVPPFSSGFCQHKPSIACDGSSLFCSTCVGDATGDVFCNSDPVGNDGMPCGSGGICTIAGDCVPGAVRVVRSFSGITPDAAQSDLFGSGDGDGCVPSSSDPGWYEVIEIDKCAVVTVDFCCTTPTLSPVWVVVTECEAANPDCAHNPNIYWEDGGFGPNEFITGDPNRANVLCADGNASVQWTLRAGRWAYGIFAQGACENSTTECASNDDCPVGVPCESNAGPYQGHWTVTGCRQAACCHAAGAPGTPGPGATCSVTDILDCEGFPVIRRFEPNLGGDWLGDLAGGIVDDCSDFPCSLGSCCVGPDQCDDNGGLGQTPGCGGNPQGIYHGGMSCADDLCRTCTIDSSANCQSDEQVLSWASDVTSGFRIADDFIPLSGTIERLCWAFTWSEICEPPERLAPPDDVWSIVIYESDPVTGLPLEGAPVFSDAAVIPDGSSNNNDAAYMIWTYTAPIGPVSVTPGNCYWLQIQGYGDGGDGVHRCFAYWMSTSVLDSTGTFSLPSNAGNNFCLNNNGSNAFAVTDIDHSDFTFCVDSGIQSQSTPGVDGGCGVPSFACCRPGPAGVGVAPSCIDTITNPGLTVNDCLREHRGIVCPGKTCSTASCDASNPTNDICSNPPLAALIPADPPNDDCANATPIGPGDCVMTSNLGRCAGDSDIFCTLSPDDCPPDIGPCVAYFNVAYTCGLVDPGGLAPLYTKVDNRLANRDGPLSEAGLGPVEDCPTTSPSSVQADVWFTLVAPCSGEAEFRTCYSSRVFDGRIVIHEGVTNNCVSCGSLNFSSRIACQDGGCADYYDAFQQSWSYGADRGHFLVSNGKCYTIRFGGYAFSSSTVSGDSMLPAYGIADMELNVHCIPVGANAPLGITTYPHGATKQRYISFAPDAGHTNHAYRVKDVGSGAQYYISTPRTTPASVVGQGLTFVVSDAAPIIHDWTGLSAIHVGGCMIAPGDGNVVFGREYEVRATTNGVDFSPPLTLYTAARPANGRFWADIAGTYSVAGDGTTSPPTPPFSWTPPNRAVSGFDINAAFTAPHVTWRDVNPELTDRVSIGPDILRVVNAFSVGSGKEYYPYAYPEPTPFPTGIHGPTPPSPALCPPPPLMTELMP
ncbi:MAG: hypothetical protein J5J06_09120 [Phycisphaerae bacterium]|nr:hypothetical protein [Phycisphaerae bacterium]